MGSMTKPCFWSICFCSKEGIEESAFAKWVMGAKIDEAGGLPGRGIGPDASLRQAKACRLIPQLKSDVGTNASLFLRKTLDTTDLRHRTRPCYRFP